MNSTVKLVLSVVVVALSFYPLIYRLSKVLRVKMSFVKTTGIAIDEAIETATHDESGETYIAKYCFRWGKLNS